MQVIVFDFGRVIGHFDYRRGAARLADHTHLTIDEILRQAHDAALEDEYDSGRISSDDFITHLRERCALRCSSDEIADAFGDIFWANDEVCALIPRLAGQYRLLLGSNTCELHARRFKQQFADTLRHFEALVLSYEVGTRKPAADFFSHCHRLAGVPLSECVFIDDLAENVAGARAAGWQAIQYTDIDNLKKELARLGVEIPKETGACERPG